MARLPRLEASGQPQYVVQRGHSGQPIVLDDVDRRAYLSVLGESARAQGIALHAYTLLGSEAHLLLQAPHGRAVSALAQSLGRRYVVAFNQRHGRSGTLWEGRFRAGVIESGAWSLACMVLIDSLAVTGGLVSSAAEGNWSSAPHRLGLRADRLLSDPPPFWQLGNTPFEREAAYGELLRQGVDGEMARALQHAARRGWALGSPAFLAALAQQAGRPPRPRPRGRPPKAPG